ncbi:hypothetical protein Bca52824_025496 [Brassica carinata]|uniref:Uncharacterized protein n=1 Tax=Brassica carinata TaxID=52824 RepID=A0A8X7SGC3_BRACI|nr:hypothetical protein Bca52824_025496 [Brassica carinata]
MTSVCVKNVSTSPEKLSPASHSRKTSKTTSVTSQESQNEDPVDFEFLLEDPVTMLTADELFSDGKLVPLKFSGAVNSEEKPMVPAVNTAAEKPCRRLEMEIDPTSSPRELLAAPDSAKRRKKLPRRRHGCLLQLKSQDELVQAFPQPEFQISSRSRSSSSSDGGKDSDISESSASISSSRLSLSSSSSSGHELDDVVPRLSRSRQTQRSEPFARSRAHHHLRNQQQRKPRRHDETTESGNETRALTVTADSPRLNASGKIVFHGLESSSSPGNFTGGPRLKQHHGMPRSQSAHVRVTPVLNVPVSSLRGGPKSGLFFGQLFTSSSSANRAQLLQSSNTTKNRTNRTRLEPTSEL